MIETTATLQDLAQGYALALMLAVTSILQRTAEQAFPSHEHAQVRELLVEQFFPIQGLALFELIDDTIARILVKYKESGKEVTWDVAIGKELLNELSNSITASLENEHGV